MTTRFRWVLAVMLAFLAATGCHTSRQGRPVAMMPAAPIDNTPRPKAAGPARGTDPSASLSTALAPLKKASGEEEAGWEFPIPKAPSIGVSAAPKTDLAPPPPEPVPAPPSPIQPIAPAPPTLPPAPPQPPPKQTSDNSLSTPSVSLTGLVPIDETPSADKIIVIGAEDPDRVVRGLRPSVESIVPQKTGNVYIVGDTSEERVFRGRRTLTTEQQEKARAALFAQNDAAPSIRNESPASAAIPSPPSDLQGVPKSSGKRVDGNGVTDVTVATPPAPPVPASPTATPPVRIGSANLSRLGIFEEQGAATTAPGATSTPSDPPVDGLSKLRSLADRAKQTEATMTSYTLRLRQREAVGGKLRPEEVLVTKFRKEPFSVYLKWVGEEHKNREVVFVKGQHEDKIHTLLAPGDHFLFSGKPMAFPVDSPLVKSNSRYPITDGGLGPLVSRFGKLVAALEAGDTREGTAKHLGTVKRPEFDEPVEAVSIDLPPSTLFPKGGRRFLYFNAKAVPVLVVSVDDQNREVEYYCHDRILCPSNLDDDDFNPSKLFRR